MVTVFIYLWFGYVLEEYAGLYLETFDTNKASLSIKDAIEKGVKFPSTDLWFVSVCGFLGGFLLRDYIPIMLNEIGWWKKKTTKSIDKRQSGQFAKTIDPSLPNRMKKKKKTEVLSHQSKKREN